ncbi:MAG TPA: GNAT family N-acetyltransferase [Gaiellaceae bacterium]|nr:GNAT family N-acetyltransferase [Gaiellaceae bacterium]
MLRIEIRPFADEHLDDVAGLLAQRHARHRESEPLLSGNLDFRAEVEAVWNSEEPSGAVALRNGEFAGYLLGVRRDDTVWGPNVWVELAGHAVREPDLVRDLYAVAAAGWVEQGRTRHYAVVPVSDRELVDAWFRLSFGAQHAFGIQEVPAEPHSSSTGFLVRRAEPGDAQVAARIDALLPEYQQRSPGFSGGGLPDADNLLAEYREALSSEDEAILLAEQDGKAVGLLTMAPVERSGMHTGLARPERACILGFAATVPEVRGSGAGLALTEAGFAWAREQGYETVVVDWRETNLLSSRFWPRRGFRRTFLRLYRSIP